MSDWQTHYGGDNPFAGVDPQGNPLPQPTVEVEFRCHRKCKTPLSADKWRWRWGHPFPREYAFDIARYRKVTA